MSPVIIVANVDASAGVGTSPKTGETADWMTWLGAAVVLGAAAMLVRKPKRS